MQSLFTHSLQSSKLCTVGPVKESRTSPSPGNDKVQRNTSGANDMVALFFSLASSSDDLGSGLRCGGYRHGTNWVQVAWLRRSEPMRTAAHDRIGAVTYSLPRAALHSES
jgi:hypothetical protein